MDSVSLIRSATSLISRSLVSNYALGLKSARLLQFFSQNQAANNQLKSILIVKFAKDSFILPLKDCLGQQQRGKVLEQKPSLNTDTQCGLNSCPKFLLHSRSTHLFSKHTNQALSLRNFSTQHNEKFKNDKASSKPSIQQLQEAKEKLEHSVTNMLAGRYDYGILHMNVVMESSLFKGGKTRSGVLAYAIEILKLRLQVHFWFPGAVIEVKKVDLVEESGLIKLHWRLKVLAQKNVLKVWRLFRAQGVITDNEWEWIEACSYFYLGADGLVHKHKIIRATE